MATGQNLALNSELYQTMLENAEFALYEQSISQSLFTQKNLPLGNGTTIEIPIWDKFTAQTIALEAPIVPGLNDTTTVSMTVMKHAIASEWHDEIAMASEASNIATDIGLNHGMALAEQVDANAFSEFNNITTDIGGTGVELTVDIFFQAAAMLRDANVPGPYNAVFSPNALYALRKQLGNFAATFIPQLSDMGNQVLSGAFVTNLAGINIFESTLLPKAATDSVGAIFAPRAFNQVVWGSILGETDRDILTQVNTSALSMFSGTTIIYQDSVLAVTVDNVI